MAKVAIDRSRNLLNEINLMNAEVAAMNLVSKHCSFKVAKVQYYDILGKICKGDYFFMEKLHGDNLIFVNVM